MTEQNQKTLYDYFIKTGQLERAKAISDVPRYAKFAVPEKVERLEPEKTKSIGNK